MTRDEQRNVAWVCSVCKYITTHPSASREKALIQVRQTTLCLKCIREKKETT